MTRSVPPDVSRTAPDPLADARVAAAAAAQFHALDKPAEALVQARAAIEALDRAATQSNRAHELKRFMQRRAETYERSVARKAREARARAADRLERERSAFTSD